MGKGVMRYADGSQTANTYYGELASMILDETLTKLASRYAELEPYLDPNIVGLSEEYVPAEIRRSVVGIDGFVHDGEIYHYCISDNVYDEKNVEKFDCIVTP